MGCWERARHSRCVPGSMPCYTNGWYTPVCTHPVCTPVYPPCTPTPVHPPCTHRRAVPHVHTVRVLPEHAHMTVLAEGKEILGVDNAETLRTRPRTLKADHRGARSSRVPWAVGSVPWFS